MYVMDSQPFTFDCIFDPFVDLRGTNRNTYIFYKTCKGKVYLNNYNEYK